MTTKIQRKPSKSYNKLLQLASFYQPQSWLFFRRQGLHLTKAVDGCLQEDQPCRNTGQSLKKYIHRSVKVTCTLNSAPVLYFRRVLEGLSGSGFLECSFAPAVQVSGCAFNVVVIHRVFRWTRDALRRVT